MLEHLPTPATANPSAHMGAACDPWSGNIRELDHANLYHFQWHLLRLEADCRRARFGNPASDVFLQGYAARLDLANTRMFGCFVDGHMRGAVEIRSLRSEWCPEAELAFSVEKGWQGRGIGTALMGHVVGIARTLTVDHLYLSCHIFNRRMQCIAKKFAAKMAFDDCECFADIAVHWEPVAPPFAQQPGLDGILTLDL